MLAFDRPGTLKHMEHSPELDIDLLFHRSLSTFLYIVSKKIAPRDNAVMKAVLGARRPLLGD